MNRVPSLPDGYYKRSAPVRVPKLQVFQEIERITSAEVRDLVYVKLRIVLSVE